MSVVSKPIAFAVVVLCLVLVAGVVGWRRWGPVPPSPESFGPPVNAPLLKTAATHPMQYYVSLPTGWSKSRTWPVVVTIGPRNWLENATMYGRVRDGKKLPFILVTPLVLTHAREPDFRTTRGYSMPDSAWDLVEREGRCPFDFDGVRAVIADVQREYNGEETALLTGFSAGGNMATAMLLVQPELFRGVAIAAGNYAGRCVDAPTVSSAPDFIDASVPRPISKSPSRVKLPVRFYLGERDAYMRYLGPQRANAVRDARVSGYENVTEVDVPRVGHDPMVVTVLDYFGTLAASK